MKSLIILGKKITHTMRYFDNLLTMSLCIEYVRYIYPAELELNKTAECPTALSYSDLHVATTNRKYSTVVYDKQDSFILSTSLATSPLSWLMYVLVEFAVVLRIRDIGTI